MFKLFGLILLGALAFVLEPVAASEFAGWGLRPDLPLSVLVAGIIVCPGPAAVIAGGAIGLLCDCLAGSRVGPLMAAFALLAAIGSLTSIRPLSLARVLIFSFGFMGT